MENSGELTQEVKVCWAHAWAGAGAGVSAATLRPSQSQSIDMVKSTRFLSSKVGRSGVVEEIIVWSQWTLHEWIKGCSAEWGGVVCCAVSCYQSVLSYQLSPDSSTLTHRRGCSLPTPEMWDLDTASTLVTEMNTTEDKRCDWKQFNSWTTQLSKDTDKSDTL